MEVVEFLLRVVLALQTRVAAGAVTITLAEALEEVGLS
jgi:hypothetical protein